MTESPTRPPDEDGSVVLPPAPPPAAPWWGSSSVTGPRPTLVDPIPVQPGPSAQSSQPLQAVPEVVQQGIGTGPQPRFDGWVPAQPASPLPQPGPAPQGTSKRKVRTGLVAALVVGAGVLAASVAAALVVLSGGEDVPVRKVSAATVAGGLRKDAAVPAASAAYPFIAAAVRAGGVERAASASAIYRGPQARDVLFLGGAAPVGDPGAFLVKAQPSTVIKTANATPGKRGGRLSCGTFAVLAETHLYCAWATGNSFGFVASNTPATDGRLDGLASLTRLMRADLEKTVS
jgi:hypothetical protein